MEICGTGDEARSREDTAPIRFDMSKRSYGGQVWFTPGSGGLAGRSRKVVMKRFRYAVGGVGFLLLARPFPPHAGPPEVPHDDPPGAAPPTDTPPIRLLMPPEQVQLLEP